jgi:hypothetical protein
MSMIFSCFSSAVDAAERIDPIALALAAAPRKNGITPHCDGDGVSAGSGDSAIGAGGGGDATAVSVSAKDDVRGSLADADADAGTEAPLGTPFGDSLAAAAAAAASRDVVQARRVAREVDQARRGRDPLPRVAVHQPRRQREDEPVFARRRASTRAR